MGESIEHWINDGLMSVFFLLIGLELKREILEGELSNLKTSLLPLFGAIGGMAIPAIIYFIFNYKSSTVSGIGIPMATDIAFALGILSLIGNKIPTSLKIFLTALAVIDDLGAIIIIALFYSAKIYWINLCIATCLFFLLLLLKSRKVNNLLIYLVGGCAIWYFMLHSGIHATIAGVLLAAVIPYEKGNHKNSSLQLLHSLHIPVNFFILPLFALANTAIKIDAGFPELLHNDYTLGIGLGLMIGKPLGIFLFCFVAVKIGWCKLNNELNWKSILGAGVLGGIGFTMSIFITLLAFKNQEIINNAKLIILLASFVSGVIGFVILKFTFNNSLFKTSGRID
jgi:NhaA family Na+:H+ antiporter